MAHVQAGHDDALALLFDRYHLLVLSVAFKILRDLGEAEDVTQTVFLEIYQVAARPVWRRRVAEGSQRQRATGRSVRIESRI